MYVPKAPSADEEARTVLTATGRRAATSDALGLTLTASSKIGTRVELINASEAESRGTARAWNKEEPVEGARRGS